MAKYDDNASLYSDSELYRRGDVQSQHILYLRKKKIMGFWMNPTLLNSWFNVGGDEFDYQYCLLHDDWFRTRGTIDGGAPGSIAYIVPELWRSFKDIHWHGTIVGTNAFATFTMKASTGEVTVDF